MYIFLPLCVCLYRLGVCVFCRFLVLGAWFSLCPCLSENLLFFTTAPWSLYVAFCITLAKKKPLDKSKLSIHPLNYFSFTCVVPSIYFPLFSPWAILTHPSFLFLALSLFFSCYSEKKWNNPSNNWYLLSHAVWLSL